MLTVVGGPTATGKSEFALDIAQRLAANGRVAEIINADAMQRYRGMDIGTAKLPVSERRGIPHWCIDTLVVTETATVAGYQAEARQVIERIEAAGKVPILVGGTGLYIHSVINQMQFPGTDPEIRASLEAEAERYGTGTLLRRLALVDPESAASLKVQDVRRIVRALEVFDLTGTKMSEFTKWSDEPWRPHRMIVLTEQSETLNQRIESRVDRMWKLGLLDEVRELSEIGLVPSSPAGKAIGYQQALQQLAGEIDETVAKAQTTLATQQYAKRQRTWFRRYREALELPVTKLVGADFGGADFGGVRGVSGVDGVSGVGGVNDWADLEPS